MPTQATKEKKPLVGQDKTVKKTQYIEGIGRRKEAVARVRITEAGKDTNTFTVNNKQVKHYFPTKEMQLIAYEGVSKIKAEDKFNISVHIKGGGIHSQAEALRHGLSRALIIFDEGWRTKLKKSGLLKRDPRMKERKKFGKKKARKSPQWSKR